MEYKTVENIDITDGKLLATPFIDVTGNTEYKAVENVELESGKKYAIPVANIMKGDIVVETDPVYTADKPTLALKTDLSKYLKVDDFNGMFNDLTGSLIESAELQIDGANMRVVILPYVDAPIVSEWVAIPNGLYKESEPVGDVSLTGSPSEVCRIEEIGNTTGSLDVKLNMQGTITRSGGNSTVGVVTIFIDEQNPITDESNPIVVGNFDIGRDLTSSFTLNTKKYNLTENNLIVGANYEGTGTVSLNNPILWIES